MIYFFDFYIKQVFFLYKKKKPTDLLQYYDKMGVSMCHKIVDLKAEGSPLLQGSDSICT